MMSLLDLQLLTIFRFLLLPLCSSRGRLLDVRPSESPWRDLLPQGEFIGVDADMSGEFGMRHQSNITYYDGKRLPYDDNSFDHVLCTEELEHLTDPRAFLTDLSRFLRAEGTLILTVPWPARLHHLPHEYGRFTRFGLFEFLNVTGFTSVTIQVRGKDSAVIANKLIVLLIRLLRTQYWFNCTWTWTWLLAAILLPLTCVFLGTAHVALLLHAGSRDDPLSCGAIALNSET